MRFLLLLAIFQHPLNNNVVVVDNTMPACGYSDNSHAERGLPNVPS